MENNVVSSDVMASPQVHEKVLELLEDLPRKKVLDMGCGKGSLTKALIRIGFQVDCCDIHRQVDGLPFVEVDLNQPLPYEDETYDIITCVEVIEHIENQWQLMREMYRILKPKGYLILSTPNLHNWYNRIYFLFTTRFPMFCYTAFVKSGHKMPTFLWNLERMIEKKFKIKKIVGNRSFIPLLGIPLPFTNIFFAEVIALRLQKDGEHLK